MATVNELIAGGKVKEAAKVLSAGLLYIFNNYVPNVQLTKEEWATVAPELVKELQTPSSDTPSTPTEGPGDDVVVTPTKADLVIEFKAAEGSTIEVPPTYTRTYTVGKKYSYNVPTVEGATPDKTTITGTMVAAGVKVTVTYTANS